jgi:hypothetical protein
LQAQGLAQNLAPRVRPACQLSVMISDSCNMGIAANIPV